MRDNHGLLTLTDLAHSLRRSWRTLLVGVLAGLLVGVALFAAVPQRYTATATVRVDPSTVDPLEVPKIPDIDMAAEQDVAASRRIAGAVDVNVAVQNGSTLMEISHTSDSPRAAATGANTVARSYLADRSSVSATRLTRVRAQLRDQIATLDRQKNVSVPPQLREDLARSTRLETRGGQLIEPAAPPESGNIPGLPVWALAGALLGLLAAAPIAVRRAATRAKDTEIIMIDGDTEGGSIGVRLSAALEQRGHPTRVIEIVDTSAVGTSDLKNSVAAYADHVMVVRGRAADPLTAQHWIERLRSAGIPVNVVLADEAIPAVDTAETDTTESDTVESDTTESDTVGRETAEPEGAEPEATTDEDDTPADATDVESGTDEDEDKDVPADAESDSVSRSPGARAS